MPTLQRGEKYYDENNAGVTIQSVSSFVQWIADTRASGARRLYFRGDGEELIPHIGKRWFYGDRGPLRLSSDQERSLLHRFLRFAHPDVNPDTAPWEALFIARHHGLPTRLFDWSTNPLVALYFALALRPSNREPGEEKKYVWAIELFPAESRADIDVLAPGSKPLEPAQIPLARAHNGIPAQMQPDQPAIKIVFPVYNSARITAQRGVFTWQSEPWKPVESYCDTPLPDENLDLARIYRWFVPSDLPTRTRLMRDLQHVGIDARAVYPDLGGVCEGLFQAALLFESS